MYKADKVDHEMAPGVCGGGVRKVCNDGRSSIIHGPSKELHKLCMLA